MARVMVERQFDADKKYVEINGLSTDTKPTTGIIMGSVYFEIDTGDVYMFNETASSWVKQGA